jgi:hypothetical protein
MDNIDMSSLIDVYVIPWGIKIVLALAIFYMQCFMAEGCVGYERQSHHLLSE